MNAILEAATSNAILATLLALAVAAVTRWTRHPSVAYWLWLLVLVRLVVPPIVRLPLPFDRGAAVASQTAVRTMRSESSESFSEPLHVHRSEAAAAAPMEQPRKSDRISAAPSVVDALGGDGSIPEMESMPTRSIITALIVIWITGSLAWFALAAVRLLRFRRRLKAASPAPPAVQREARNWARALGLRNIPDLVVVPATIPPLLCPFGWRPTIVLPAALLATLDRSELRGLLAHELLHWRLKDHWFRGFAGVVLGVYWWHPVAWWAHRRLRQAEEECCDASVLRLLPDGPKPYAEALLKTLDFLADRAAPMPPAALAFAVPKPLARRFDMILRTRPVGRLSRIGLVAIVATGLLSLVWSVGAQDGQADVSPEEQRSAAQRSSTRAADPPPEPGLLTATAPPATNPIPPEKAPPASESVPPAIAEPNVDQGKVTPQLQTVRGAPVQGPDEAIVRLADLKRMLLRSHRGARQQTTDALDPKVRRSFLDLEQAFWKLVAAHAEVRSSETGRDIARAVWLNEKRKFEIGTGSTADTAQAEEQYQFYRVSRLQALSRLPRAESALRNFPGIDLPLGKRLVPWADVKTAVSTTELDWQGAVDEVMSRPFLCSLRERIADLEGRRAALAKRREGPATSPEDKRTSRDVQLRLVKLRAELSTRELALFDALDSSYATVSNRREVLEAQRKRQTAAERQVYIRTRQYEQGTQPIDALLQSHTTLADAGRDLGQAVAAYRQSLADWDFARGAADTTLD